MECDSENVFYRIVQNSYDDVRFGLIKSVWEEIQKLCYAQTFIFLTTLFKFFFLRLTPLF